MKRYFAWVLRNRRGRLWTYTSGMVVTFSRRSKATECAGTLYKPDGWKAVRAELTVEAKHG